MSKPAQPVLSRVALRRPKKRRLGVAVGSDVHLGTYGCHAPELLRYLKSIRPQSCLSLRAQRNNDNRFFA